MRKVSIVFLWFAFCFTGRPSKGQTPILISVTVSGPEVPDNQDKITQKLIQGYIGRGLRESGESVRIVPYIASSYQGRIIALERRLPSGVRTGDVSISYVLTKLSYGRNGCDCYLYSGLAIYNRSDLREACDLIVATIDQYMP